MNKSVSFHGNYLGDTKLLNDCVEAPQMLCFRLTLVLSCVAAVGTHIRFTLF